MSVDLIRIERQGLAEQALGFRLVLGAGPCRVLVPAGGISVGAQTARVPGARGWVVGGGDEGLSDDGRRQQRRQQDERPAQAGTGSYVCCVAAPSNRVRRR